ncbi:MAG: hypothetical protein QNJ63_28980, partial [Calothrix sp. MO_192.B10]|nr:hypothetical protein [Calothrix sp. MO_192.B10]
LMSAFISLPQAVLYSPRLIRLPLNVYLLPGLYLVLRFDKIGTFTPLFFAPPDEKGFWVMDDT